MQRIISCLFFFLKIYTYRSFIHFLYPLLLHSGSWRGLEPAVPGRRLTLNIFIKICQSPKAAKLSNSAHWSQRFLGSFLFVWDATSRYHVTCKDAHREDLIHNARGMQSPSAVVSKWRGSGLGGWWEERVDWSCSRGAATACKLIKPPRRLHWTCDWWFRSQHDWGGQLLAILLTCWETRKKKKLGKARPWLSAGCMCCKMYEMDRALQREVFAARIEAKKAGDSVDRDLGPLNVSFGMSLN